MKKVNGDYTAVLKRTLDREMNEVAVLAHEVTRTLGAGDYGVNLEGQHLFKAELRPQAPREWVVYAELADIRAKGDRALNEEITFQIKARAAAVAEAARALTRASLT